MNVLHHGLFLIVYIVWIVNNETDICTQTLTKIITLFTGKEYSDLRQEGKAIMAIMDMTLISHKMANMVLV